MLEFTRLFLLAPNTSPLQEPGKSQLHLPWHLNCFRNICKHASHIAWPLSRLLGIVQLELGFTASLTGWRWIQTFTPTARPGLVYSWHVNKNLMRVSSLKYFKTQSKPASLWMLPSIIECRGRVDLRKAQLRINKGLVDDAGVIRISWHLHLPLGFCSLEVDAILNLRYRIKQREYVSL